MLSDVQCKVHKGFYILSENWSKLVITKKLYKIELLSHYIGILLSIIITV